MGNRMESFYAELDQFYKSGDLTGAEYFLLEHAERELTADSGLRQELIAAYNELGGLYRSTSRFKRSLAAFEKARVLAEAELGSGSGQYATILNNMAGTCRKMRRYEQAVEIFEQAREIYRQNGLEGTYEYASVLNNLSLAYRENRQDRQAIRAQEEALEIIEELPDHERETAISYGNLTLICYAAGDKTLALQYLNRALRAFEKCADHENEYYAPGMNSLAAILYSEGIYEEALAVYRRSARYILRHFGETFEYGVTCRNTSWVYERLGRTEEAIEALERSKKTFSAVLGGGHECTLAAAENIRRLQKEQKA